MQLNMTTDYALRCMLYLAGKDGLSSSVEIGKAVGLNKTFAQKVLRVLRDAGLVYSEHGSNGGYRLAKRPEEIVLLDVIILFEKTMKINSCLEAEGYCKRSETCPMHAYYAKIQKVLESFLGRDTLQDIMDDRKQGRRQ